MPNLMLDKWDYRYMDVAKLIASWSKDPVKQVGCILVDDANRIVSTGYNGPPAGVDTLPEEDRLAITIHAEENAIIMAARQPYVAYIYPCMPCSTCMAKLAQLGIQQIYSHELPSEKWRFDLTNKIARTLDIELILI